MSEGISSDYRIAKTYSVHPMSRIPKTSSGPTAGTEALRYAFFCAIGQFFCHALHKPLGHPFTTPIGCILATFRASPAL